MAQGADGNWADRRTESPPQAHDATLLLGIRHEESAALKEFVRRFRPPLLDQARRLGIHRAERETVVTAFMHDMLLKLTRMPAPRSLQTFVVRAFRNHVADVWRADAAREQRDSGECDVIGGQPVVSATCSAFSLRAVLGPEDGGSHIESRAAALINALINTLMQQCTPEERSLLVWSSQRVPVREIASWLGISYSAAKQRLARLRSKLANDSIQHLATLDSADRAALGPLLRRAGVIIDGREIHASTNHSKNGGAAA